MKLNQIRDNKGARKESMRVARGVGSGKGRTGGRGFKGQKSRTGVAIKGFEGGQMPLQRRLPKRGFVNIFGKEFAIVNLAALENKFEDGAVIDIEALKNAGLVSKTLDGVKVLAHGDITKKFTVKVNAYSDAAKAKIEAAGGKAEVI